MAENDAPRRRFLGLRLLLFLSGLAIGLLFSPNTGRANRAWLRQKTKSLQANLRRLRRDLTGKTDYEMGRIAGFIHTLGERTGIIREEVELSNDITNQRVKTELGENPKTGQIPRLNIDTFEGVVTIRGHVENEQQKWAIEDVATLFLYRWLRGIRILIASKQRRNSLGWIKLVCG